jgi:hypothetical protein
VTIAYKDGTVYSFSSFNITGNNGISAVLSYPSSVKDSNGNTVSVSNSGGTVTMTDTAGRTAITVSPVVSNNNTVTVSGLSSPYTEHWTTYSSNFNTPQVPLNGCGGGISANTQGTTAVQSLTLPNSKSYQFQYDSTYGLLKLVTYPSGGFVRYTWGVNPLSEFLSIPTPSGDCWWHYGVPAITRLT